MSVAEAAEQRVAVALLRSSLASTRNIVEACRNVIEHPETLSEEQRQSVIEVLGMTLHNIDELLAQVPVEPITGLTSEAPQTPT